MRAYLDAGSFSDAVRVFSDAGRPLDAARLIMKVVRVAPDEVGTLTGEILEAVGDLVVLGDGGEIDLAHTRQKALELFGALTLVGTGHRTVVEILNHEA